MINEVIIDLRQLSYQNIMECSFKFDKKTILVHTPFASTDSKTPLNYFIFHPKLQSFLEFAREHRIKLIFDIMLSSMGTKKLRKKALKKAGLNSKEIKNQITSLSKAQVGSLKRSLFLDQSRNFFRKKKDHGVGRLLDLEKTDVVNLHTEMLSNLLTKGIFNINIMDYGSLSSHYTKEIFKNLGIKQYSIPHNLSNDVAIHDGLIIIRCEMQVIDEEVEMSKDIDINEITVAETKDRIINTLSNDESIIKEYDNKKSKVMILVSKTSLLVINSNLKNQHKFKKNWPKRSFKNIVNGVYVDAVSKSEIKIHKGDFQKEFIVQPASYALYILKH